MNRVEFSYPSSDQLPPKILEAAKTWGFVGWVYGNLLSMPYPERPITPASFGAGIEYTRYMIEQCNFDSDDRSRFIFIIDMLDVPANKQNISINKLKTDENWNYICKNSHLGQVLVINNNLVFAGSIRLFFNDANRVLVACDHKAGDRLIKNIK